MGDVIPLFRDRDIVRTGAGDLPAEVLTDTIAAVESTLDLVVSTYDVAEDSGDATEFWQALAQLKREVALLPEPPGG